MKVTEFEVSRKGWLRGEGSSHSFLFRKADGKMCCLGFFCAKAGCSPGEIAGVQVPHELEGSCKDAVREQLISSDDDTTHPQIVNDMMTINDRMVGLGMVEDVDLATEEQREQILTKMFAEIGVKVNFVD